MHHGFNTCKLLLIEFLTNLLQDFFLGLEGKSSESCFLPKERQTDRQTETVSDFFLSLGETTAFGFYCLLFYFLLLCWDWWGLQSSYLCHILVHHLNVENGLLLLCCVDLKPGGVEETWGRCVVYTRWTNPLLLSRKNSENSVLCLALVAIVSHGAASKERWRACTWTCQSQTTYIAHPLSSKSIWEVEYFLSLQILCCKACCS